MSNVVPFSLPHEIEQARQRVEEVLAGGAVPGSGTWTVDPLAERGSHGGTFLFIAHSRGADRKVVAKLYRRPQDAALEHEAARTLDVAGAPVARPLCCDAEHGVYISENVEGESLEDLLATSEGERALAAAGRWLRQLHTRTRARRPYILRPSGMLVRLCDTAAGLPGWVPEKQRWVFERGVAKVARQIAASPRTLYRPVRLHGDYVPSNLILSSDGLVAVDCAMSAVGHREVDLAAMNVRLATMAEEGPAAGAFGFESARETFLAAYGLTDPEARRRLEIREAAELLRRWRNFARTTYRDPAVRDGEIRAIRAILARRGFFD